MTSTIGVTGVVQSQPAPDPAPGESTNESPNSPGIAVSPMPAQISGHRRQLTPDYDPSINAKPYSPFYRHATPNLSATRAELERLRRKATDLESGIPHGMSHEPQRPRQSKLWEEKRRCVWWRQLSHGTRFALEIVIAVVIMGGMVGIALGITAAVGGGALKSKYQPVRLGE